MELHRSVSTTVQMLNRHHSLLVGALRGCDATTQQDMLNEHRAQVATALESLARLGAFIDHCRIGEPEKIGRPDLKLKRITKVIPS